MAKIDEKIIVLSNKGAISGRVVRTDYADNPIEISIGEDVIFERSVSGIYYLKNHNK